ncbi:MAG: TonB-dependent receptor plug domain-containing protein, partial [Paramuribaculum sp.]|nr:TonB-dependent receptor plug domain-containing protein [Paramuribaculum sp.]
MSKHKFSVHTGVSFIVAVLLLLPNNAVAQSVADTDSISKSRTLSTVTVSGKRNRSANSTAPLYNIGVNQINRFSITDIGNAVRRLPGVNLRDYGGAGGLKTVSVRGLGAAHTSVAYDGIMLGNSRNGEIDLSRYSLDNISNLTLRVGDNDDIFQTARAVASAASLSLTSAPATGDDSLHLTAKLRAGSFGYASPSVKISKGFGDKWAANIFGDFMRADNRYPFKLKNGSTTTTEHRKNSKAQALNAEANITFKPRAGASLTTKLYYYDSRSHLPGPVIYYNDDNKEKLTERSAFWQSTFRATISPTVALLANAKFNWDASLYSDTNGKYPGGKLQQNYYQREAYASAAALWTPTSHISLSYAADYTYNGLTSNLITENHPWRNSYLQSLGIRWKSSRVTATVKALASIYRNGSRTGTAARNATRISPSASIS